VWASACEGVRRACANAMHPSLESITRSDPNKRLLRVRDVVVRFGGIVAFAQMSFDVPKQKIVGPIGPNGAGKTTLFNSLSRLYGITSGGIEVDGLSILKRAMA